MPEIQVNPPLDPKKIRNWVPPEQRGPTPEKSPGEPFLGSFFARAAALLIDMVLLYLLAWAANQQLRDPLLALGPTAAAIASLVLVAYFAMGDGPVGRGRTLGKYLMQLGVVTGEGTVLDWRSAVNRSIIKTAPGWGIIWLGIWSRRLDPAKIEHFALAGQIVYMACVGLLLANSVCAALDPLRRAAQDFAARTFVVKALHASPRAEGPIRQALQAARPWTFVHWLALAAALLAPSVLTVPSRLRELRSEPRARNLALDQELLKIIGNGKFSIIKRFVPADNAQNAASRPQAETTTSPSLAPAGGSPKTLIMRIELVQYRKIPPAQLASLNQIENRMPEICHWCAEWMLGIFTPEDMTGFQEQCQKMGFQETVVEVRFWEILDLGYTFAGEPVLRFERPFDKADLARLGILPEPPGAASRPVAASNPASAPRPEADSPHNSGSPSSSPAASDPPPPATSDTAVVYYFHATPRCPACLKIETDSQEALNRGFASALTSGRLQWRSVDIDQPENDHFVRDYQLQTNALVVVGPQNARPASWKNLERIWDLTEDQAAFIRYVQDEVRPFLAAGR